MIVMNNLIRKKYIATKITLEITKLMQNIYSKNITVDYNECC